MPAKRVELIMGMPIEIDARDASMADRDLDPIFDWFRHVDETFSTYRPESEISRLNRREADIAELKPEVQTVLARCEELTDETTGYFVAWNRQLPVELVDDQGRSVTAGIDPSGYVKGWAVDRAAEKLSTAGCLNFFVNAGGDIRVKGGALPETQWRVGIQHPQQLDKIAGVVETSDLAIATSGEYQRGHHIVNPHTGLPPTGVLSVTVVGPDLGTADAYATAAFAMGDEGPRWTMGLKGYEAMTILANELVLLTPGFPKSS